MSDIKIGSTAVADYKMGETDVVKIMIGTTEIWVRSTGPEGPYTVEIISTVTSTYSIKTAGDFLFIGDNTYDSGNGGVYIYSMSTGELKIGRASCRERV